MKMDTEPGPEFFPFAAVNVWHPAGSTTPALFTVIGFPDGSFTMTNAEISSVKHSGR
jgi:hypothetical protein